MSADPAVPASVRALRSYVVSDIDGMLLTAPDDAEDSRRLTWLTDMVPLVAALDADLARWRSAALLDDRTRRAIRDRHQAGESVADLAADYGAPEAFVTQLVAWQLFGDESTSAPPESPR